MNTAMSSSPTDHRIPPQRQEQRGEICRKVAAILGQSRYRSDDTVMYLAMTELQKRSPASGYDELLDMYAEVIERMARGEGAT